MGIADLSLDIEDNVSCFVPAHVKMEFGQDSKVVVVGRAREYNKRPSMNVYGVWALPGQIGLEELDLISGEEDIIDVGWVEEEDFDISLE